jgi:hypothetical protein
MRKRRQETSNFAIYFENVSLLFIEWDIGFQFGCCVESSLWSFDQPFIRGAAVRDERDEISNNFP